VEEKLLGTLGRLFTMILYHVTFFKQCPAVLIRKSSMEVKNQNLCPDVNSRDHGFPDAQASGFEHEYQNSSISIPQTYLETS